MSESHDRHGKPRPLWNTQSVQSTEIGKLRESDFLACQHCIHFEKLYGELTIPGSEYVAPHSFISSGYVETLVGKDSRPIGEIYRQIEPALIRVTREIFKDPRLTSGHIIAAKELRWPKIKRLDGEEHGDYTERFILELKEKGISLTDTAFISATMWSRGGSGYREDSRRIEDAIAAELKDCGYRFERRPWVNCGYNSKPPGSARLDIWSLRESEHAYVGEMVQLRREDKKDIEMH